MLEAIDAELGPSRERSIVVTKLQEASMFAVRGVASNPDYQKPDAPRATLRVTVHEPQVPRDPVLDTASVGPEVKS